MKQSTIQWNWQKTWLFLVGLFLFLDGSAQTVYVTKTGKKYHAEGCQYLRKRPYAMVYADAVAAGYDACSRCGYRLGAQPSSVKPRKMRSSHAATARRCHGITKKGKPCKRRARHGSDYCFQHGG